MCELRSRFASVKTLPWSFFPSAQTTCPDKENCASCLSAPFDFKMGILPLSFLLKKFLLALPTQLRSLWGPEESQRPAAQMIRVTVHKSRSCLRGWDDKELGGHSLARSLEQPESRVLLEDDDALPSS